jgi:hypothetical protein
MLNDKLYTFQDDMESFSNSDAVQERAKQLLEEGKADRIVIWQMVCDTDEPLKVCA